MLDDLLAVHANSLRLRARRTNILASNIANADTPNYKARDLEFAEVLRDAAGPARRRFSGGNAAGLLHTTSARHITNESTPATARLMYRQPQQASLDGNTVDKDLEQARFAENTVRYQASLEFASSRVKGLMRALRSE